MFLVLGTLSVLPSVVLDVVIFGNQSLEFCVTPVVCTHASRFRYVPYGHNRKLFLVNMDVTVKLH